MILCSLCGCACKWENLMENILLTLPFLYLPRDAGSKTSLLLLRWWYLGCFPIVFWLKATSLCPCIKHYQRSAPCLLSGTTKTATQGSKPSRVSKRNPCKINPSAVTYVRRADIVNVVNNTSNLDLCSFPWNNFMWSLATFSFRRITN